jgi:hypothetical protein
VEIKKMKLEDTLKQIFEGMDVLDDTTKGRIATTFAKVLDEAKVEQEKALRVEMSERYAQEKKAIYSALEQFLEQELSTAVADFKQGIDEVDTMKKQYADKTVAVKEQARAYVATRLGAIDKVIEGILKRELSELHESEKVNRRAYLNAITESKAKAETDHNAFRTKAAAVLENIVNVQVQGTLDELRGDIKAARESDFGREIYETFMTTFRRQFFDSSKEFQVVTKQLAEAKATAQATKVKAGKLVKEARIRTKAAEGKTKRIEETVIRARAISKMLKPLSGQTHAKMKHILEATSTEKLAVTYKKLLPEMLNEAKRSTTKTRQRKIEETVVELKTGGRKTSLTENKAVTEDDDDIVDIKRLAGLND